MATFAEFVTSLDADAGKRGKQFEGFVKWFLKTDPEWITQVDQVWLWEEYPDRWGIDCGIDLVFRHKNGGTWAVQAKCYSHQHDITKHDVDKFLSESNRKGIDRRLLIATTDRIGANAKQVCDAQEKTVVRYLLSNFESADVEYPASIAELHTAKRKTPPQPRDHQIDAITAVSRNFQDADRGQLIMACGTGKTFTTLWVKESLQSNSTLVLLPSLGLLSQTLHEWTLAANQSFDVLCVCSDDTVGKRGGDEAVHSVTDLAFPVTSNITDITDFLKRGGARVIFSTYQSSPLVAEAQIDVSTPPFDLVIADEAHRCAGKVGSDFSTVLDSDRIRARKRLFTTATPRTYSTNVKKAAGERGIEVVGMDDEAVFGKVLFSLPFGEAIKRGLLTDYQVVIIGVDNPTIAVWIENRELLKTDSGIENDAESLAAQIGLLKAFKDYDLQRVISFHSRVSRAESFTQDIQQVAQWVGEAHRPRGSLKSDFVSGAMPTDRRRRKLSQLKALAPDERGLLANARCLSEGVDVPSLDGVAFIDPRSSQIDIIQAVGRAIRLSPNKKTGTIVLPVFIEDGDTPIESIEASNFKPIWDVLNALKAHDDVLSAEMDQLRTEMGRKSGSTVGAFSKIQIDLPSSVDPSFGESLRTHLVERVTDSWECWYGLLQTYVAEHGDSRVPQHRKLADGIALGYWTSHQRQIRSTLSTERAARLESLPGWTWNPHDEAWEVGFRHLIEYSETHGDCLVPDTYGSLSGFSLGSWVGVQRQRQSKLPPDRQARLESLTGWSWDPRNEAWEVGFRHLIEYSETHGDCSVLAIFKSPDEYALGAWVNVQRTNKANLSPERKAQLESVSGWSWEPLGDAWETGFRHLTEYSETHGDCLVPAKFKSADGYALGTWTGFQRSKRAALSTDRKARLESLTGWSWNSLDQAWEAAISHLTEYSEAHGDCLVPAKFKSPDGYKLGHWVNGRRTNKANLSPERKAQLESVSGWSWNPHGDVWEQGFRELTDYALAHGNCLIPQTYKMPDGRPLGRWAAAQRKKNAEMSQERKARLESLVGWSWNVLDGAWETGFRQLSEYSEHNGDCLVPALHRMPDGYPLGRWVSKQRTSQAKMKPERKVRLESLNGWTWKVRE